MDRPPLVKRPVAERSRTTTKRGDLRISRRHIRFGAAAGASLVLSGCSALDHGFLNAAGPVAAGERHLFFEVLAVLAFVAAPVLVLTPIFAWHYRLSNTGDAFRPKWTFSWPLEGFIWIPPILIVLGLATLLWTDTHKFDPYAPLKGGPPLRIQAVALDWKWLFIYPDERVATVGELDVPAGRPVRLELTSGTVMQSLLLPRLAGQIYAMAGMSTRLNILASRPGVYRGENTQYNGERFQDDSFNVVARTPAAYARWLAHARSSAEPLDGMALQALMQRSAEPHPQVFSAPPPGLYAHILAETGGASQPSPQASR